jgi:co-chaperonin GroES (HSP10)
MFIPSGDKMVIEILDSAMTAGGVLLSEAAGGTKMGVVKSIGPGRWEHGIQIPTVVKIDDTVIFLAQYSAKLLIKGRYYDMLEEKNIVGHFEA